MEYYRQFIYKHADIALPLTKLLKHDETYEWNEERQQAFQTLKDWLVIAPILSPSDWSKKFHVFIDLSAFCIGANLSQKDAQNRDHPIYHASRQMSAAEKNCTVIEREALAIIFACKKFWHYLLGYQIYLSHRS